MKDFHSYNLRKIHCREKKMCHTKVVREEIDRTSVGKENFPRHRYITNIININIKVNT